MSLWMQLDEEMRSQGVSGINLRKAQSALRALGSVLGGGYVLANPEADLAERVEVPGDSETWIVFGTWDDGSLDVIRQHGMFSTDVMVGWVPGQSRADYFKELKEEFVDGEEDPDLDPRGKDVAKGARGGLAVVPGGGLRRGKRKSGGRRKGGGDTGKPKNRARAKPTAGSDRKAPLAAAESVVQHRTGQGKSES